MSIQESRRAAFARVNPPVSGCRLNNQIQPYGEFYQSWPELTGDPVPDAEMVRYNEDWALWNVALDSVVIDLPPQYEGLPNLQRTYAAGLQTGRAKGIWDCRTAIEAVGIRVEMVNG